MFYDCFILMFEVSFLMDFFLEGFIGRLIGYEDVIWILISVFIIFIM